jgi:hypothetical protein
MTPKEKAKDLISSFYTKTDEQGLTFNIYWTNAKQCALIAVEEILEIINETMILVDIESDYDYWQEVKEEILKL